MDRRAFLSGGAAAATFAGHAPAQPTASTFFFIHFTDTHLQPELGGDAGTRRAFEGINRVPHDFCLAGGDLVMDVWEQTPERSRQLMNGYIGAVKTLQKKVHSIPGNHDVYGIARKSGVAHTDPLYGKKLFEDRVGPRFSSFDHKGWHFVLLDSIGVDGERFYGVVDEAQLDWLAADLARVDARTPIVVMTHIPLATAVNQFLGAKPETLKGLMVTNAQEVFRKFDGKRLVAILQGHTHVNERIDYKGLQIITTGAVCGNWWKGAHLGIPEGFAVLKAHADGNLTWKYQTYGWKAYA